jgi:DNA-binding beta-propeller fold protein YncE
MLWRLGLGVAVLLALLGARPGRASEALVVNSGEASLSVVDMQTEQELRRIPLLREPHHVTLTPDRHDLLVGDTVGNTLFDLDPMTFAERRRLAVSDPYQFAFSPNGRYLTVNGLGRNQVDVYDATNFTLVQRFEVHSRPSHLAYAPDSATVYVSLQGTGLLAAIDLAAMQPRWTVPVGSTPAGVLWLNGKVLVAIMGADYVAVVDAADGHVEQTIHTGRGAHQLFLSPDRKLVWVNNRVDGTTTAIDAQTLAPQRTYKVPGGPDDIAFAPNGELWITERFIGKVAVLDPATGAVRSIRVGRQPHGLFLNTSLP